MPVLDRTAAGLEPGGLQRLLPRRTPPPARSRTLHPAFWQQHGPDANSCRTSRSRSATRRPATEPALFTPNMDFARAEPPLSASTFLLDFLYPHGALRVLRRPAVRGRLYGSLLPDDNHTAQDPTVVALTSDLAGEASTVPPPAPVAPAGPPSDPDGLHDLLQTTATAYSTEVFDRAWALYTHLPSSVARADVAADLLRFLSPSRRRLEAQRSAAVYAALGPEASRDPEAVALAVRAQLGLGAPAAALALCVASGTAAAGFGALVADALQRAAWPQLAAVWAAYKAQTSGRVVEAGVLAEAVALRDLRERLQQLATVVERRGALGWGEARAASEARSQDEEKADDTDQPSVTGIYAALVRAALPRLGSDALPFVQQLRNVQIYEAYVHAALDRGDVAGAAAAYSAYRQLPGFWPQPGTLRRMVSEVYGRDGRNSGRADGRGMAAVLKDWYSTYGRPTYWGYQRFLGFYAARGDVATVQRLWNELTATHPEAVALGGDTFSHLLKAYAVRGDVAAVEQVFGEIATVYGQTPNTVCWNIRLHAHVARGRTARAMAVFDALCAAVAPDDYSYGTLLALAGGRGDLPLVHALLAAARRRSLPLTEAMLDPLVEAYCHNDRLADAERVCVTTSRHAAADGTTPGTALWNTLLRHHALRHDLVAVHRLLRLMTRLAVPYDGATYGALLFALAQCRQPRRAVALLRAAQDEQLFQPTAHHYLLLMMAYVRSRQPHRALQVNRLMHHLGYARTSRQTLLVIKAFSQWQEFPPGVDASGVAASEASGPGAAPTPTQVADRRELLAKALREFQRSLAPAPQDRGREAVRLPLGAVRRFSFVVFMLVQARDFVGVDEVVQLYRTLAPPADRAQPLPLKLCNALLLAHFYEGRYDRAKETWQYVLDRTREIARPQPLPLNGEEREDGGQTEGTDDATDKDTPVDTTTTTTTLPVARLRYGLTDPLKTMQRLYTAERDADALIRTIGEVRAAGFWLDSKNWNHYVQNLARLGRTPDAFAVCEEHLMHHWSGFESLRRHAADGAGAGPGSGAPHDPAVPYAYDHDPDHLDFVSPARARQLRETAPRFNRPMAMTFMVLARAFLELERSAPWSSAAERQFHDLVARCPKTVHAVRTMARMNSRLEGRAFDDEDGAAGADRGLYSDGYGDADSAEAAFADGDDIFVDGGVRTDPTAFPRTASGRDAW